MVCYFARKDAHFISHFSPLQPAYLLRLDFFHDFFLRIYLRIFALSARPDDHRPTGNKNCPINGK